MIPVRTTPGNSCLKKQTQQPPAILHLCLRKTREGKSRDFGDVIVLEKLGFQVSDSFG